MITSAQANQNHQENITKGFDPSKWDVKMYNQKEFHKKFSSYCQACFRVKEKSLHDSSFRSEKGLTFMHCYNCKISSHLYCYGMDTEFHQETLADGEVVNMFLCEKCRSPDPTSEQAACQVCKLTEGGFKKCDDGTWVHVVCALFHDDFEITNFETLKIKKKLSDKDHGEKRKGRYPLCDHCGNSGASNMVKCGEANCNKISHIYCILKSRAKQNKKKSKTDEGSPGSTWQFLLNINDESIEKKVRAHRWSQYRLETKKITDYAERITKMFEESHLTPKKGEDSAVKRKRGGRRKDPSKGEVSSVTQMVRKIKTNGTHIFSLTEEEQEEGVTENGLMELKNSIAKRITVKCANHTATVKFCLCDNSTNETNEEEAEATWIACDFCDNWYHTGCVGLDNVASKDLESYFCERCLEWAQIKMDWFEELETIIKSKNGFSTAAYNFKRFIPRQTRFMHICDLICSSILLEILIERALNSAVTYKEIHELIISTFVLPLDFTQSIKDLCYKAYKGMVVDEWVTLNDLLSDMKFESLLLPPDNKIKEGEYETQKGLLQLFEKILGIYQKECNVASDVSSKVENITAILRWQMKVVDILQIKKNHKVSFEEMKMLYSEFDGIAGNYLAIKNREEKQEEETGDEMLIESSELNDLVVNEKEQLSHIMNSCKEWTDEYDGLLKKMVGHLEKLSMSIENEKKDSMNIEDSTIKENENGEVTKSQLTEEDIQKIINRYLEFQNSKIKVQEFDNLLAKAEKYPVEFGQEKRNIIAEKAKYEDLRQDILKLDTNHMTPDQFEHRIEENNHEIFYIPEMKRLYDLLKDFKIFSLKYQDLHNMIEVTKEHYSQASKENLLKDEKPLKVSIDEVKSLLEEAHKLPLDLSMYILPLQEKIKEANKFQDFLTQVICGPSGVEDLMALKMQALQIGVLTPEIVLINDKIKVSQEIKERIQNETTSEELEYQINLAERHMADPSILKDMREKYTKIDQIRQHSYLFMCKKEFNETDLKKVYYLLEEASKLHINFDEKEFLMSIIKSFSWFFELQNLLSMISHPDYIGKDEPYQPFEKFDVSKIFKLNIGEDIAFCTQETTKETLLQYAEQIFEKFQKLMQFGEKQTHSDSRIKDLHDLYAKILWSLEVRRLRNSSSPIVPGTLIKLYQQGQANQQIDKLNEDHQWLNSTFVKYNTWVQVLVDKIYMVEIETLCEESKIKENYNVVQQIISTYPSLNIQMDFLYTAARYASSVMEWQFRAEKCENILQGMNKITYESVNKLNECISELKLSENFRYVQMVSTLFNNANQLIEENLDLFQILHNYESSQEVKAVHGPENSFSEAKSRFCVDIETGFFKMDFYTKSEGEKYSYQKALAIAEKLKTSPISFEKDYENIKVHLDKYEAWYSRVGEIRRKYKVDEFLLSSDEFPAQTYIRNMDKMINDIDGLKIELTNLIFFDEGKENELFIIEWNLAALLLITKQGLLTLIPSSIKFNGEIIKVFNENNFAIWESLEESLREYKGRLMEELDNQVQKSYLYRILTEQIVKARGLLEIIKDILSQEKILGDEINRMSIQELSDEHKRDYLRSLGDIKQVYKEIEELLVNINTEKSQLDETMKRHDELMKQYETLEFQQQTEKISLSNAENLLRELLSLPIRHENEDKNLQKAFKEFQALEEDLIQVRKDQKDNKQDTVGYALAEKITENYRKSLIHNSEAEKIQKDFEKGETLFKKIETVDMKVTFEEAIKYYEQICHLKVDFGSRAEKKRLEFWKKIVDFIRVSHEGKNKEGGAKGARLTFEILKELLSDTYKVYKEEGEENKEERTEIVAMMEELVKKVEDKLQEIYDTTDVRAFGKMDTIVGGLVSVKGELQSHSQRLIQNSSYQGPKITSVVKNLLKSTQQQGSKNVNPAVTASGTKGRPGRKPNASKMKQSMEVEKVAPAALKRKESEEMTVSEPVFGRKSRKKLKEEDEEEEEIVEEKKKFLKTEKGAQKAHEEEVKSKPREKNIEQIFSLLDQNKFFTFVNNKNQMYQEIATRVEGYAFKEFSDNLNQYNTHTKTYKLLFSKLKCFKNISWGLSRGNFTKEAISYLIDNVADLDSIEKGISQLPSKDLSDYIKQEKLNEQQENIKDLIATNAHVANIAEPGPIKANPDVEIPHFVFETKPEIGEIEEKTEPTTIIENTVTTEDKNIEEEASVPVPQKMQEEPRENHQTVMQEEDVPHGDQPKVVREEEKRVRVKQSPAEKIAKLKADLLAQKVPENIMMMSAVYDKVNKENKVEPRGGLGESQQIQEVSSKNTMPDPRIELYQKNRDIFKVHEGDFVFEFDSNGSQKLKVNLLSMAHVDEYAQILKIPSRPARMTSKVNVNDIVSYLDKITGSVSDVWKVIIGWFQAADGDNAPIENFANKLKQARRAGRCKYGTNSSIYSFHIDDFKSIWSKKLTFNQDYLASIDVDKFKPSSLVFFMTSKHYTPTDDEPPVEPKILYQPVSNPEPLVVATETSQSLFPAEDKKEEVKETDEMEIEGLEEKAKEPSENKAERIEEDKNEQEIHKEGPVRIEEEKNEQQEINKGDPEIVEEEKNEQQEINKEDPEIIKGYVRSYQDTSFIGIDSQGRPKYVETGDMQNDKKDMEIESIEPQGALEEGQKNNEGARDVDKFFM